MKIKLQEVRQIVRRLLEALGTTCIKCGYDNPFMDPVEDYVCRQCRVRDEKFGGKEEPSIEDIINNVHIDHDREEDLDDEEENPYGYTGDDLCQNIDPASGQQCTHYVDDQGFCTDPNCSCCGGLSGITLGSTGGMYDSFSDMRKDHPDAAAEWLRTIATGRTVDEFWEAGDGHLHGLNIDTGDTWIWNEKQKQWIPSPD